MLEKMHASDDNNNALKLKRNLVLLEVSCPRQASHHFTSLQEDTHLWLCRYACHMTKY
jgi:hypothetical protein